MLFSELYKIMAIKLLYSVLGKVIAPLDPPLSRVPTPRPLRSWAGEWGQRRTFLLWET